MPAEAKKEAGSRSEAAKRGPTSREMVRANAANEFFFGVVGHVGSGTSQIATSLKDILENAEPPFDVTILKARYEISEWDEQRSNELGEIDISSLRYSEKLQDLGDAMREENDDFAAVARSLVRRVRETRRRKLGVAEKDEVALPDGQRRAYILDSIRHPMEVALLRNIYSDAFLLVGVVCEPKIRLDRLTTKYPDAGKSAAELFMDRDAKADKKSGQRVSDAFHLSDYFIDNTEPRFLPEDPKKSNPNWLVADELMRLRSLITHSNIVRPRPSEKAMYSAHGAQLRSACLSRQVGAAIIDHRNEVVALGTNEAPQAGGGVYGTLEPSRNGGDNVPDHRCAFDREYCSNTREQNAIAEQVSEALLAQIEGLEELVTAQDLAGLVMKTPVGALLEFSRAVHAEMEALLSLARRGVSAAGCRMFVTTFPCHYCARHLIGAGVDEVQYIEPYPKSKALDLHRDAIQTRAGDWNPPSKGGAKVLFRPFVGVAPRLYARIFAKDRTLKDKRTGEMVFSSPDWREPLHIGRQSYIDLENKLSEVPHAED